MTAERQQFSLALGLAAGVNLLLFLGIVWIMAITQGLSRHRILPELTALPEDAPEIVVNLTTAPDLPPEANPAPPRREKINSPEDATPLETPVPDAQFTSDQNLRAASEEAAAPDGKTRMASQKGIDKPFLDLRDSDFRDGAVVSTPPPEPAAAPPIDPTASSATADAPAMEAPPAPTKASQPTKPADPLQAGTAPADTPPDAAPPLSDPRAIATDDSPPATASQKEEEAPPAFKDPAAAALIPLNPKTTAQAPRPKPQAPPPLTRIPDRVPEAVYMPGRAKSKAVGTITNKGKASVDATATAEGKFDKSIRAAIEKNWRRRMLSLSGLANPGLVEVEFEIDPKGRISNVKLANPGEANPVMQDCALSAVIEAKLPPPPTELFEELRDTLTGGRMRCSFSFLIY